MEISFHRNISLRIKLNSSQKKLRKITTWCFSCSQIVPPPPPTINSVPEYLVFLGSFTKINHWKIISDNTHLPHRQIMLHHKHVLRYSDHSQGPPAWIFLHSSPTQSTSKYSQRNGLRLGFTYSCSVCFMKGEGPWDLHFSTCINLYTTLTFFFFFRMQIFTPSTDTMILTFFFLIAFALNSYWKGKEHQFQKLVKQRLSLRTEIAKPTMNSI